MKKLIVRLYLKPTVYGSYLYEIDGYYKLSDKQLRQLRICMNLSSVMDKLLIKMYGQEFFKVLDRLAYIKRDAMLKETFNTWFMKKIQEIWRSGNRWSSTDVVIILGFILLALVLCH